MLRTSRSPSLEGSRPHEPSADGLKVATCGKSCPSGRITTDPHPDIPACVGCARCCHLLVELKADVDFVPEELVVEYHGMRFMDQQSDGACVALDPITRACTIYEDRPWICRQFDRGGALCRKILIGPSALRAHTANVVTTEKP